MEEARRILERLGRIEAMKRADADPASLLGELRVLLQDAEAWARLEGGDRGEDAVARLREALARDMIAV